MDRKFGIEMEIAGINRETALRALRAVGINVQNEGYNHTTRRHWKLVSDASVRGGFEVVSPVLEGEAGLAEAEMVARALDDAGASVNVSCGLHVHFDAADLSAADIKAIVRRYAAHEAEIDAFMPRSRRGNANQYCRSLAGLMNDRFERAHTMQELIAHQGSRYFKVNLQSFQRHGTIEFRQHSGTINASKVANWVRFLADFIGQCKRVASGAPAPARAPQFPALLGVQGRLWQMLEGASPVLLSDICAAFGWQPHTARAAVTRLRRAGLDIKAVKVDGKAAYRFNGQGAPAQEPAADSLWNGVSEPVAQFYQRRAAVLAAAS